MFIEFRDRPEGELLRAIYHSPKVQRSVGQRGLDDIHIHCAEGRNRAVFWNSWSQQQEVVRAESSASQAVSFQSGLRKQASQRDIASNAKSSTTYIRVEFRMIKDTG